MFGVQLQVKFYLLLYNLTISPCSNLSQVLPKSRADSGFLYIYSIGISS
jgi:hypothetical protein